MSKLSEQLRSRAIELGLCAQWQKQWGDNCSVQELIDKFKHGIDFCLSNDFPDKEIIKSEFDRDLLHKNLIYVDETVSLDDAPNGVYVLNGECSGTLRFRQWAAATVYLRHTSRVAIIADDFARVFVRLYDDADADTCSVGESEVRVYDRR